MRTMLYMLYNRVESLTLYSWGTKQMAHIRQVVKRRTVKERQAVGSGNV